MAELRKKVKCALDEARILVLGSQVLMGFEFRSFFETRFNELSPFAQHLKFASLLLMLLALLLLIMPAAFHRIVEQGEATEEQHRFTTAIMDFALLPFALVLAADLYLAVFSVATQMAAIASAIGAALVTFFFWYGLEWWKRAHENVVAPRCRAAQGEKAMTQNETSGRTPLADKIEHVLTECRVVLPGVQALLGFQFATTLMEGFEKLPALSKQIHLVSLGCIALSMVLLVTPAAFHRIVEEGEETERFHRFATVMLLAALVPLALGMSGELFVVTDKLMDSPGTAAFAAMAAVFLFGGAWFGLTFYIRGARRTRILNEASAAI